MISGPPWYRRRRPVPWIRTPWYDLWQLAQRRVWRRWPGYLECEWEYATDKQVAREFLEQEFDLEKTY